jgi:hypothetical protein
MKVLVVGGGFSGCFAAQWLVARGHQVALHEASGALGGVMRDHVTPSGPFAASCHYLNVDAFWFPAVADMPGEPLMLFDHHYGAWTDLGGPCRASSTFAQPDFGGPCPPFEPKDPPAWTTLEERIQDYPPPVRDALRKWMTRAVDPTLLHASAAEPLQVGRVGYLEDHEGVSRARAASRLADRVLGVPRNRRSPPLPPEQAAIPLRGYSPWFDAWAFRLTGLGVRVRTRAPVRLQHPGGPGAPPPLHLPDDERPDAIVWCANPTPLSRLLLPDPLRTPPLPIRMVHLRIDRAPAPEPWYWQVFSLHSPILRGYWYPLDGPRLSLECMQDDTPVDAIVKDLHTMLRTWGRDVEVQAVHESRTVRYALLEAQDPGRLAALRDAARPLAIVVAGHEHYGRNARLQALVDAMTEDGL